MSQLSLIKTAIRKCANPRKAKILRQFFKTGTGQYGEGDRFFGITVPESRNIAQQFDDLSLKDIATLLSSKIHEERLIALLILVHRYQTEKDERETIFRFYLRNAKRVNNWDLVDLTAHHIVGCHLYRRNRKLLYRLAQSRNLWERRIAIVSTFYFIRQNDFSDTFRITKLLLRDSHDLIHKAAGWMLREAGKRSFKAEETFLKTCYHKMPRTMLRYAIERFPEKRRRLYLEGKV